VNNRNTARKMNPMAKETAKPHAGKQAKAHSRSFPSFPGPDPGAESLADDEIQQLEGLDEFTSPPLRGKTHPPAEMGDATPTLDDEVRSYHHHPNDAGVTEFGFDPEAADAAADLAGELGSQYLEGATRGEDLSDRVMREEDRSENEVPFLIEDELEPSDLDETAGEEEPPGFEQQRVQVGLRSAPVRLSSRAGRRRPPPPGRM
jgi:hypothetical protein